MRIEERPFSARRASLSAAVVSAAILAAAIAAAPSVAAEPDAAIYLHRDAASGVARAYCPRRMTVIGGGGFVETAGDFRAISLRQAHPISDRSGVIAFGSTAIGYQTASSDFSEYTAAFSICATTALSEAIGVQYVSAQGTGFARAFCPTGSLVIGGGAFVESSGGAFQPLSLRQSYPISDETGVIAYGNTAIGWQAASSNFEETVVAFTICATPTGVAPFSVQYVSAQNTGVARAFCPAGTTLTGGGAFVETPDAFAPVSLRQTYPISDASGVIASGRSAVGWQAASSNFEDTVASFAICATF